MKYLLFSLVPFLVMLDAIGQCPDDIILATQAEIDAFPLNYGCAEIVGNLNIGTTADFSDINNLEALTMITSVGGNLIISYNSDLEDLSGLNNLSQVEGFLAIYENDVLHNLSGLESLETVGESLKIRFNPILPDLLGLENLISVGGDVEIYQNPSLVNLNGLQSLNSIGSFFSIRETGLINLTGLESLENISAYLEIKDNTALVNLAGLDNLSTLEELEIIGNSVLSDIDALQSVNSIEGHVHIQDNPLLTNLFGLENVSFIGDYFRIQNNNALLGLFSSNNLLSIGANCSILNNSNLLDLTGLEDLTSIGGKLSISDNTSLLNLLGLNSLEIIESDFLISNNANLISLNGFDELSMINGNFDIANNNNLISISGIQKLSFIDGYLNIADNNNLQNLFAFTNLTEINGGLFILSNNQLETIAGFNKISLIDGDFDIKSNDWLISIETFQTLSNVSGNLRIQWNDNLQVCCEVVNFIDQVEGFTNLFGNEPSCNSFDDILEACGFVHIEVQAFLDENENELYDANEVIINSAFVLNPLGIVSFSGVDGNADFYINETGEYQLSNWGGLWEVNGTEEAITLNFDSIEEDTFIYVPIIPIGEFIIQDIDLSSSITRCNQTTNYWLTYANNGTTINDGYVYLITNVLTSLISANPSVDFTNGDTLFWFYEDLYPTQSNQIFVKYGMPSGGFMGQSIDFEAGIETLEGFGDHKAYIVSELLCAYDPNDKLVTPVGEGVENYTLFGDTLAYTIRFQNTGNDTALSISISDTLSEHLDLLSFRPIASSHSVETNIDLEDRIVTFLFEDIYLPDSFVNEPDSHGFVKFEIQANQELNAFTPIENTAGIFFDYNPPIVTNTVLNTFTSVIPSVFSGKAFLEGAYANNGLMSTDLTEIIPLTQPFNVLPYEYNGNESLSSIPAEMVDWVLIEARTGSPSLSGDIGTQIVEKQAGMLMSDGTILNHNGTTGIRFLNLEEGESYYFAVRHRNHLDVLTAIPITATANLNYDFTLSVEAAYGTEQQKLTVDNKATLFAGDANSDGIILNTDYDEWFLNNAVLNTYDPTDWNLDGVIQTTDYDLWFWNKAKVGIVEFQE